MALDALTRPCAVDLYTDSQYVRGGVTSWIKGWKARGWKTADRKPVKNINFGLAFTMGIGKLAEMLGRTVEEARPLIDAYHEGLPFVRQTSNARWD